VEQLLVFVTRYQNTSKNGVFHPVGWQPGTTSILKKEEYKNDSDPKTEPVKF
jgi:hypothetical protein